MDRLFDRAANSPTIWHFTNRLAFAERAVAWSTGWEIFNHHPLFGVGLGNAGFFFNDEMPSFGWLLTEIRDIYYRQPFLFNTKSIWARLLAEGGIFSFVFFAAWIYLLWRSARAMMESRDSQIAVIGWTGAFFLVELVFEGFSIDSFALPYIWFTAGLVTAGAHRFITEGYPETRLQESVPAAPAVHPDHQHTTE